jgi:gluconolactonase
MSSLVKRTKIASLLYYTEGPVIDDQGNFYCTTLTGGSILKINRRKEISEWGKSACPNGQIILPEGDHLICDSKLAAVRRFDPDGNFLKDEIKKFCADFPVHVPNDLIIDKEGNLYFTDSVRHMGKVCFLGINGDQKVVIYDLDYPNGLVLSDDGKLLYVAESYQNRIIKIKLKEPGVAGGAFEVFANLPNHPSGHEQDNLPDGLALDADNNLFIAHYGMQAVQVLSENGSPLKSIDTTMPYSSNVAIVNSSTILVTGGYGEPGPGALFLIEDFQ